MIEEREEDKSVGFMGMTKDESERFIFKSIDIKTSIKESIQISRKLSPH